MVSHIEKGNDTIPSVLGYPNQTDDVLSQIIGSTRLQVAEGGQGHDPV